MDILAAVSQDGSPVAGDIEESLVQPFIAAVTLAFTEMAGTEVVPLGSWQMPRATVLGDVSALIRFTNYAGAIILGFPRRTALAVSKRILANVPEAIDEGLMLDCLGEVANVIAGQAKALVAAGPYHFVFSTPTVVSDTPVEIAADRCLAVAFRGELGDFALQIFVPSAVST